MVEFDKADANEADVYSYHIYDQNAMIDLRGSYINFE